MNSTTFMVISIATAFVFYLAVPGLGAVMVRHRWRQFRARVLESTRLQELRYGSPDEAERYRLSGRLEAVQGDDLVWLGKEGLSVGVYLRHVPIYLIPSHSGRFMSYPDETPRIVYWREISALAEGTRFYVAGRVVEEPGGLVFRGDAVNEPLVIIYDGPEHSFLKRTIWTGRQRNEYWNQLTLPALTGGFLAQLVIAVFAISVSRLVALVSVVLALVPVLPLVPPGVVGYFFYRRIWRAARRRRAVRDVIRIGSGEDAARAVGRLAWAQELFAVVLLLGGIWLNAYGIAVLLALTVFAP